MKELQSDRHVVVFTGRRFLATDYVKRVEVAIADMLEDIQESAGKPVLLLSGMAMGADLAACRAAIRAGVPYWAVVPFVNQPERWPVAEKAEWSRLCQAAEMARFLHAVNPRLPREATAWLLERNGWMVDRAKEGIAVWEGAESGGTFHAVGLIKKKGLAWHRIDLQGHIVNHYAGKG